MSVLIYPLFVYTILYTIHGRAMVEDHVTDQFRYQLNPCSFLYFHHDLLTNDSALTPRIVT